jgi:hypothetical protein
MRLFQNTGKIMMHDAPRPESANSMASQCDYVHGWIRSAKGASTLVLGCQVYTKRIDSDKLLHKNDLSLPLLMRSLKRQVADPLAAVPASCSSHHHRDPQQSQHPCLPHRQHQHPPRA